MALLERSLSVAEGGLGIQIAKIGYTHETVKKIKKGKKRNTPRTSVIELYLRSLETAQVHLQGHL